DRNEIEPREIPAGKQDKLKHDRHNAGDRSNRLRQEKAERNNQFHKVVEQDTALMNPRRRPMEVPTEWIRHRLRLEIPVEARQIAPARIASQLDQASPEHHAEEEPAHQPDGYLLWSRPARSEEDREEHGFEQNGFPAKRIERLAHVHERHVKNPDQRPNQHG